MFRDYHVHSGFLDHTKSPLEAMIQTAVSLGFGEVAITEHYIWHLIQYPKPLEEKDRDTLYPNDDLVPSDGRKSCGLNTYLQAIEKIRSRYPISILSGLEVDYFSEYEHDIRHSLMQHHFDLVTAGCHYIRDPQVQGPDAYIHVGFESRLIPFVARYGEAAVYRAYYENLITAVRSGLFHRLAHLDYLKQRLPAYSPRHAAPYVTKLLMAMVQYNVGLEVNLKGFDDVGEPYPSLAIIAEYRRLGGKNVTLGSDAHSVNGLNRVVRYYESLKEFL